MKFLVFSFKFLEKKTGSSSVLKTKNAKLKTTPGFTLVETLLAISLLAIAITAPMLLTVQALTAAHYARDEITAFYLAQEAIESVHAIRDGQVLQIALNANASSIDIFGPIAPYSNHQPFTIDATNNNAITSCSGSTAPTYGCPALQSDGTLYGYRASGWKNTNFTRVVQACYIQGNNCSSATTNEVRIEVTVSWQTASYTLRQFKISEDLYRWIQDGAGV